jgi:hypothetical protein
LWGKRFRVPTFAFRVSEAGSRRCLDCFRGFDQERRNRGRRFHGRLRFDWLSRWFFHGRLLWGRFFD